MRSERIAAAVYVDHFGDALFFHCLKVIWLDHVAAAFQTVNVAVDVIGAGVEDASFEVQFLIGMIEAMLDDNLNVNYLRETEAERVIWGVGKGLCNRCWHIADVSCGDLHLLALWLGSVEQIR